MDLENGVMTGRSHGGTAVLWRKSLTAYPVSNVDKSIVGINIKCQNNSIVIINVYLPFNSPSNVEAYLKYLGALQILCEAQQSSNLCIVGDFNANKESTCGQFFNNFCKEQGYIISDRSILPSNTFTYLSDSHHTTSWLDHCISSSSVHKSIKNISVLYDYITSDHRPLSITFCCNLLPLLLSSNEPTNPYTKSWNCASSEQKKKYNISSELLKDVSFPATAMQCRNATCDDHSHLNEIILFYSEIISALTKAFKGSIKLSSEYPSIFSGFRVEQKIKSLHSAARYAFLTWVHNGRSKHGVYFEKMKVTCKKFELSLRHCRRLKEQHKSNALATALQ